MKPRTLLLSVIATAALAVGCVEKEPDYGLPSLEASVSELSYDLSASSQTISLQTSRDWAIRSLPEWIDEVSPDHGPASLERQEVRIKVKENNSYDREGDVIFTIGFIKAPVTVKQKGKLGPITTGSGTKDDPYSVAGALAWVGSLPADTQSEENIYIKGKIANIKEEYTTNYGNGTFYISDDGADVNTFYVFRALYLGNKRFAEGNTQIAVGDEVIICGKVVNYKGNTPETVINQAFLYSLNGQSEGGDSGGGGGDDPGGTVLFYNNFDKETATQTYGSGTSWPYLDQFEGWKNQTGEGAANVSYSFSNVSARNNSNSNGNYSDYSGSGANNLLFGASGNYLRIDNIAPGSATNLLLSFGSERYLNGANDNTFQHGEFHVYVSNDGQKWVELSYAFPNGDKSGRWDKASSTFSIPSGTNALYLYFKADIASAYRLDDVRLGTSETAGTAIDFSQGIDLDGGGGGGGGGGGDQPSGTVVFSNDFDKEAATQTFGNSKNSWPFLDQFEGWKNQSGTGAANVRYEFSNLSARNNSNSNGSYSDYSGSGTNNLLFGAAGNYFKIGNIALTSTAFTLSFGSEKYLAQGNTAFNHSEFHVYASNDGQKWVELSYTFPNGDKTGRWDKASSTFSVPSGTGTLYLYFKADVASAYRLDDVLLCTSSTAGTVLDFTKGIDLDGGGSGGDGGDGGGGGTVSPTDLAAIISSADDTAVSAKDVYVGAVTTKGFVATDGKSHIYVYQNATPSVAVGDIVEFSGKKTTYYGMPEITDPTVKKTSSGTVPYPTPKDITSGFASYTNTVAEYVTYNATIVKSGNYTNFQVAGVSTLTGALSSAPTAMYTGLNAGDKVTVTGYFNGINTNSKLLNVIAVKVEKEPAATSGYGAPTATAKWLELPQTSDKDELEWFSHTAMLGNDRVRNYSYDWNYGDRVAMWVAYPLYNAIMGSGSRTEAWAYDPSMPAAVQQNVSKAYSKGNAGSYSRGHQLPSADRLGTTDLNRSTFYGTNMTPQNSSFNAGIWANLESKVRGWSTNSDTLYVITGCVLDGAQYYVLDASENRITVPTGYFKAVLRYRKPNGSETIGYQGYMAAAFFLDHLSTSGGSIQKSHAISVEELEKKLGYELFVNLASVVGAETATKIKTENPANVNWWW